MARRTYQPSAAVLAAAEAERAAELARTDRPPRSCYLAGCRSAAAWWSLFCSDAHAAAWAALPAHEREVHRYAAHLAAGRIPDAAALRRLANADHDEEDA